MPDDAACGAGTAMEKEETQAGTKAGILAQLAELDAQAEERRNAAADGSANTQKAAAEAERKIWENKMQSILETLEQQLSGDEKTAFFTEQRSWVRDRESTAVANSKKQSGSTLEELEYIRSLRTLPGNVFTHWLSSMKPFWMGQNKKQKTGSRQEYHGFRLLFHWRSLLRT